MMVRQFAASARFATPDVQIDVSGHIFVGRPIEATADELFNTVTPKVSVAFMEETAHEWLETRGEHDEIWLSFAQWHVHEQTIVLG